MLKEREALMVVRVSLDLASSNQITNFFFPQIFHFPFSSLFTSPPTKEDKQTEKQEVPSL